MKVRKKARRLFVAVEISAEGSDDVARALRGLATQYEEGDDNLSTFGSDGGFAVSATTEDNWLREESQRAKDVDAELGEILDAKPHGASDAAVKGDHFRAEKPVMLSRFRRTG